MTSQGERKGHIHEQELVDMAPQPQCRLERDYRGFETKTPITAKIPKKKPRNAQSTALRFFFFAVV